MIIRTIDKFKTTLLTEASFLTTSDFTYDKNTQTFSGEISELPRFSPRDKTIVLHNPITRKSVAFNWYKTDMDGSNEDTYGWRYKSEDGNLFILIIND